MVTPMATAPSLATVSAWSRRQPAQLRLAVRRRAVRGHRVVQDDQPAAVGEQRLDLDPRAPASATPSPTSATPERAVAGRLGLGVGAPVARRLDHLVGDQRGRLGLVEPQPARAPLARQLGGEEEEEAVLLAREEAHGRGILARQAAGGVQQRVALGAAPGRGSGDDQHLAGRVAQQPGDVVDAEAVARPPTIRVAPAPRPSARAARGARCARGRSGRRPARRPWPPAARSPRRRRTPRRTRARPARRASAAAARVAR